MDFRALRAGMALALAGGCCLLGCERRQSAPSAPPAATRPASQPATSPGTAPASTLPAVSHITINGKSHEFPRARLRLVEKESGLWAQLFSDDPPRAVRDDAVRSFYYLDMKLSVDDAGDLASASWRYSVSSTQQAESPDGIFLEDGRQLQPQDVTAEFEPQGTHLLIRLSGQFIGADPAEDSQPALVKVNAQFTVNPERKGN